MTISRTFRDLSDKEIADIETASSLTRIGWRGDFSWDEVLKSPRVLMVSEAGVGKTYECSTRRNMLWEAGEPAFYLDLATLSRGNVREMLRGEEEARLDAWLRAQSETATFFLDSIDELELSMGSFEQALIRLNKTLAGQLGRARIVITTRPIPVDQRLIRKHLPFPAAAEAEPTAEAFADMVMNRNSQKKPDKGEPAQWRTVGLMPLSTDQAREFARLQGVTDPDALFEDIKRRDAEDFAQRPMDLIELCADWREHHRIRTHREQIATNAETKLKARTNRKEKATLSPERAMEGATRLALAAMLTRKLTLRYSAESDNIESSEAALDVGRILPNWSVPEHETLLERPLFGFATYGRVRFHHRSVVEFLAAKRLDVLLEQRAPMKAIKRLLFTETAQGEQVVRPSMRPVAAWLASWRDPIYEAIRDCEPGVLLDFGDPQALRPAQRAELLEAYVARYGRGRWCGMHVPRIQVFRFASSELAPIVNKLWAAGIENPEVRELLLEVIEAGKIALCADMCFSVATNPEAPMRERIAALDALIALNDPRLPQIAEAIEGNATDWPSDITRRAIILMFPAHLDAGRLCRVLRRVSESSRAVAEITWHLPRLIEEREFSVDQLRTLREGLTEIITASITWNKNKWPHVQTGRPDLIASLTACSLKEMKAGQVDVELLKSINLVLGLNQDEGTRDEATKMLRQVVADASSEVREKMFWKEVDFLQRLHPMTDHWRRLFEITHHGASRLIPAKDASWIRAALADKNRDIDQREMMLYAEMTELPYTGTCQEHLEGLKQHVADEPKLLAIIDQRLKPAEPSRELERLMKQNAQYDRKAKRDDKKSHASWAAFWKEVAEKPDEMFAADRAENTAWNLWRAMDRSGSESRRSGWNRRFIEFQFGKDVANRLRSAMSAYWRKEKPTLWSERKESEKNTFLVRWQFGLASISAEAEDPKWASRLSDEEARLAVRYAPLELNGFPSWLDSLIEAHPKAVDAILGEELTLSLREPFKGNPHSIFLQNIRHASLRVIVHFTPRISDWLDEALATLGDNTADEARGRLDQAVDILLHSGDSGQLPRLEALAQRGVANGLDAPFTHVWLPTLIQLSPEKGVTALEHGLAKMAPSARGPGVDWFANLFGRDHRATAIDLRNPAFTPAILLRLVRLAYKHVRFEEDAHHESSYALDERDNAENARDGVLKALLATTGSAGWSAKLEMAEDPLFAHFKDRAIALAREASAVEADGAPMSNAGVISLDQYGEAPPTTRDGIFEIMRDRLDDIDELLLRDTSPREAWAGIQDEKVLRREIARTLTDNANHLYTVDQEAATADEKETDIRLRSAGSGQQAVIELKVGEKDRSAGVLRATLKDQLLKKYMASDGCKSGCLYVSCATDRTWVHPDTRENLDLAGLIVMLDEEAERLAAELGGSVRIMAKGLDLRPRLKPERAAKSKK